MERRRENLKHTKMLIDSQFNFLFEEMDEMRDEDIVEQVFVMSNMLFKMADKFGYQEKIESIIKDHYGEKL